MPIIRESREEFGRGEARLALAEELYSRRRELEEWLAADPARSQFLLSDPRSALRQAFPDLDVPEVSFAGGELVAQLIRFRDAPVAGVVVFTRRKSSP